MDQVMKSESIKK